MKATKKVAPEKTTSFEYIMKCYFLLISSDTVSFFLPLALLLAKTFLPLAVDILSLKPCLFLLLRTDG
jgi:hypothetical protein